MAHTTGESAHLLRGAHAKRLAEQRLREEIVRGVVVPGQWLVEPELGERYGVTRNSARLALDVLITEGLVERIPNRGARVRVVSTAEAVAVLECRQVLDGLLARKAAQHATAGRTDSLRDNLRRMRRAGAEQELLEYSALVREHHRLLRELASQPRASALVEQLEGRMVRHEFQLLLRPGQARQSLAGLTRVVDAVVERAADRAESAARAHLQDVIDALLLEPAAA
ncbi:GntR family transcriptional regulator [Blastococcus saxobsidens]|uniref:GntR family transcriptional regulator n=1 Tax=Blastococcus saxobsidens TaxID=138336 RepID=A0A4Q7Y2R9_9ACTN|nr:GntR family transcriptional regulator [Blastococcus saxobsidens]RZU31110.1 GntR family transcriptional regulator [Blastococcus saxobsidens]